MGTKRERAIRRDGNHVIANSQEVAYSDLFSGCDRWNRDVELSSLAIDAAKERETMLKTRWAKFREKPTELAVDEITVLYGVRIDEITICSNIEGITRYALIIEAMNATAP